MSGFDHSRRWFSIGQRVRVLSLAAGRFGTVRDMGATLGSWVYSVEIAGESQGVDTVYLGNQLKAWTGNV